VRVKRIRLPVIEIGMFAAETKASAGVAGVVGSSATSSEITTDRRRRCSSASIKVVLQRPRIILPSAVGGFLPRPDALYRLTECSILGRYLIAGNGHSPIRIGECVGTIACWLNTPVPRLRS